MGGGGVCGLCSVWLGIGGRRGRFGRGGGGWVVGGDWLEIGCWGVGDSWRRGIFDGGYIGGGNYVGW